MTPLTVETPQQRVILGEHPSAMKGLEDCSVDSVVTDPPYELGFMGRTWDKTGIAYNVEFWREVLRVLKPGGHLLSFGGSRTWHRMVCAIEDAGFEIRDEIMWLYGSGFPKSHNVSKAIDTKLGAERDVVGTKSGRKTKAGGIGTYNFSGRDVVNGSANMDRDYPVTVPSTDAAKEWDGWGTALKPAHEPICVARKPLLGTVAANVLAHGTGALNIDGCRIETSDSLGGGAEKRVAVEGKHQGWPRPWMSDHEAVEAHAERVRANVQKAEELGRWPANVVMDEEAGASRFFYCPKASKADRGDGNTHPTVKPTELMRWLVRLVTPKGGLVLDPFCGSGSTGKACVLEDFAFIGFDKEQAHIDIAERRIKEAKALHAIQTGLFAEAA